MIYDISPPIDDRLKVWPGDTPLSREVLVDLTKGGNLTLSTLHATVHLGAHADAPNHYSKDGQSIGERRLEYYLGRCQVMQLEVPRGRRIRPEDLTGEVTEKRLLLATDTFPDPGNFNEDFAALSPELVDFLHDKGVITVGIDTPSVDLFDSKDLPAHHRLLAHDMANLEGLILADVPEGTYELIALPLKLMDFDASPIRAVLRTL